MGCTNTGANDSTNTGTAALTGKAKSAMNKMQEAFTKGTRSDYREAATDFINSLEKGEKITQYVSWDNQYTKGGLVASTDPTVWTKNADGTLSRQGDRYTRYTADDWIRRQWNGMSNPKFLKGDLSPQQVADELSKIKKAHYSVRK